MQADKYSIITQWVNEDCIIPICLNCDSGDAHFMCSLDEGDLWHCNRCEIESLVEYDENEVT